MLTIANRRPDEQIDRALDYLTSKQCGNGGYRGYRMECLEEPNLSDTLFLGGFVSAFGRSGVPSRSRHDLSQIPVQPFE